MKFSKDLRNIKTKKTHENLTVSGGPSTGTGCPDRLWSLLFGDPDGPLWGGPFPPSLFCGSGEELVQPEETACRDKLTAACQWLQERYWDGVRPFSVACLEDKYNGHELKKQRFITVTRKNFSNRTVKHQNSSRGGPASLHVWNFSRSYIIKLWATSSDSTDVPASIRSLRQEPP